MIQAIIFDFNGTMFLDTDKQRRSWNELFEKYIGRPLTNEEFVRYACGPESAAVLRHFYRADLDDAQAAALTEEKEIIYRRLCREDAERFRLADGLPEALDRLQARGVPMAIGTGAGRGNLDFYFEAFHLERWFDWDHVIYDDGTLPGKPAPDVYLRACERLRTPPQDCMVVEDAFAGIAAAQNAGVGAIVAITATNPAGALEKLPGVKAVIDDYRDFIAIFDGIGVNRAACPRVS